MVQSLSCVWLFAIPWTQHARFPCLSSSPGVCSNSCPLSWWCHPTIASSVVPFSSCLQSFPASGSFLVSRLCIRWSKYWSFSFSISPLHEYSGLISFRTDHTLGSPRDSKESSPTPQFESITSFLFLSLSFLYGPTLTSTHDYWKNHSFDYTDLCWQTNVSGFLICCLGLS